MTHGCLTVKQTQMFSNFLVVRHLGENEIKMFSGAPNENTVQNHLNIALLNVFEYLNGR